VWRAAYTAAPAFVCDVAKECAKDGGKGRIATFRDALYQEPHVPEVSEQL